MLEVKEGFPESQRPAYTTVQTMVYRRETKKALRYVKRIGKANVFEAAISRADAQTGFIDDLLNMFGGQIKPVMAGLCDTGKLTMEDVKQVEGMLRAYRRKGKAK